MRILIGCPIHEIKDYSIKKWLQSVSEIELADEYCWQLFMVDNSANPKYQDKVKKYCAELDFNNYELLHLSNMKDDDDNLAERLGASREAIRQKVLQENWDYWFSWECDLICPPNILSTLVKYSKDFDVISHTYPLRSKNPTRFTNSYIELESMGIMLLPKKLFVDYGFTEGLRSSWGDGPLLHEIVSSGWKWLSLHNYLMIEHLNKD